MTVLTETGIVQVIVTSQVGTTVIGDHAAGATSLLVDDPFEFSETGGLLELDDAEVAYSTWDEDAATIATDPLPNDVLDGTPVRVLPSATITTISVVVDEEGEAIPATVPIEKVALVRDGILVGGSVVRIVEKPEGWLLDEVFKETPVVDGSFTDPDTIPPTSPVEPGSSPTPVTLGGLRQVFVKVDPVSNPTLVSYEYHVTADSGAAAPTPGDGSTLFAETPATLVPASRLADGTAFAYDTDYYFAVIAKSGSLAAAPSPWVVGRMDRTASADIVAGAVTTELLDSVLAIVGILQVGDLIEVTPPGGVVGALTGGIVVKDPVNPGGEPLVRLHPLGCSFRGQVVTDILTVMQDLIVNGEAHLASGASLLLESGVSDPAEGPSITQGPIQIVWPTIPSGYTQQGLCWDATNSRWLRLLQRTSTLRGYIEPISTSGVAGALILLGVGSWANSPNTIRGVSGITTIGGFVYYTLEVSNSTFNQASIILIRCTLSSGAYSTGQQLSGENGTQNIDDDPALGNDGTFIYAVASGNPASLGTGNSSVYASKWNGSLTLQGASVLTGSGVSSGYDRRFVGVLDFGYGAAKLTLGVSNLVEVFALPTFSGGSVAKDTALSWTLDLSLGNGGLAYKTSGADQGFYSEHNDSKLSRWSTYYPAASEQFWMKYADTDGGDTTAASPTTSQAIGKRRYASATLRPAPAGVSGADLFVGYGSSLPGTFYKRAEAINGRVFNLTGGKDTSGSTTVPSVSTMPTGSPSKIYDGFGNYWTGDGEVNLPGLVTNEYHQIALATPANPTSTTNVALAEFIQAVDCPGTSAGYEVSISADVTVTTGSNIVELLVDGTAHPAQIISVGNGTRGTGFKAWYVTGLAAGARTFTARTRNSAGSTNCTVNSVHSLMTTKRVK